MNWALAVRAPRVLSAILQEGTEDTSVALWARIVRTGCKDYVPGSVGGQEADILDDDALITCSASEEWPSGL